MQKSQRGFTLFELMIAIAVVGLISGIVVSQMNDWFDVNIKTATGKLSSTIRYLHDKATSQNIYIRLVLDVDKNAYWVEATTEQFLLSTKEAEAADRELIEKEKREAKPEEETVAPETTDGETADTTSTEFQAGSSAVKKYRTPQFGAVDEFLLKPVQFPEGVFIKDVFTSHDNGPISGGQAYIHFFPNGFIEPAIINLRNEVDDVQYSIEINPIIGTTKLRSEYKTLENNNANATHK